MPFAFQIKADLVICVFLSAISRMYGTYPLILRHPWYFICEFILCEHNFWSLSLAYNEVRLYYRLVSWWDNENFKLSWDLLFQNAFFWMEIFFTCQIQGKCYKNVAPNSWNSRLNQLVFLFLILYISFFSYS